MRNPFGIGRWSPYAVGALIGVLSWATFAFMNKALGVSTTFVRAAGVAEAAAAPGHVEGSSYFMKYFAKGPPIEWQFALVLMLPIGALIAARLAKADKPDVTPAAWRARFGSSKPLRYAGAFVGGAILLFGARLAGGCTSGHGLSGSLQLAVSGWVFFASLFVAGVGSAFAIYTLGGKRTLEEGASNV